MSKSVFYRYFCRNCRPSAMPPFFGVDILRAADYEEPVDSGNGKKMYGFIDFAGEIDDKIAKQFGLEPAPINPIKI